MRSDRVSVVRVRNTLLVTVPADPDDQTITELQEDVLNAMQKWDSKGLVIDISTVDTLDSFFARTIAETSQMVELMGGSTVIVGMRPSVAITAVQLGLTLGRVMTALDVDRAFDILDSMAADAGEVWTS
ncbi:MAG: STAS domain-containing protein [Dehalococcoidia bacterium]|nr:STAS domain-containing protein [Dehalococcoidia bacterium]